MGCLEVVIRDARAQVVDVMEPDVPGEELEDPRKPKIRAALKCRLVEAPVVVLLPVGVLELVLDIEEPDPGRAREEKRRGENDQDILPADKQAESTDDYREREGRSKDAPSQETSPSRVPGRRSPT